MDYSTLSDAYEELEKTPAKLKKTEIISQLLKKTPGNIIQQVVLLLNGQAYPAWDSIELGIANQLAIKAVSKAYGIEAKKVEEKFSDVGDLGLVAEFFAGKKKQATLGSEQLTITKVFANLRKIAEQTGKGSQEKKLDLIAELLSQAKPKEACYIIRTLLGQLRVGVAEGIIRDAIAQAYEIEPEVVESAWFVHPDYGEIAKLAREKGKKGLEKVELKLGVPIQVLLAEKSPSLGEALESFKKVRLEYKYDGMRSVIQKKEDKIWIFTRRLEDVTNAFPDVVALAKKYLKPKECVVDGETIGLDKKGKPVPFQMLSTRIKRKYEIEKSTADTPIRVNLFDIIYLDGETLFDRSLEERRELLKKAVKESEDFRLADGIDTTELKEAEKFYKQSLDAGNEGIIVKNLEAKYAPGRSVAGGWLKVKPVMENLDLVITGGTWGMGKRAGWLGSLVLACRDPATGKFLECGMLGTGIKEKEAEEGKEQVITFEQLTKMLRPLIEFEKASEVKIRPKIVVEVSYEEIQKSPTYPSSWALRFPRFIRLRPDKDAEECDTLERIRNLYAQQKGKGK